MRDQVSLLLLTHKKKKIIFCKEGKGVPADNKNWSYSIQTDKNTYRQVDRQTDNRQVSGHIETNRQTEGERNIVDRYMDGEKNIYARRQIRQIQTD